jgi:hypothetical protein
LSGNGSFAGNHCSGDIPIKTPPRPIELP